MATSGSEKNSCLYRHKPMKANSVTKRNNCQLLQALRMSFVNVMRSTGMLCYEEIPSKIKGRGSGGTAGALPRLGKIEAERK